jgi:Sulfotransferase domain
MTMSTEQSVSDGERDLGAAPDARVPDFFIVGHQKCGTTALYMMLRQHPQIFMPEVKEPWFFGQELRASSRNGHSGLLPDTLDGYLSLFSGARPGQLVGEASPQYIRSDTAPGAIAEMRPDARIVVILREPASFLRSLHMQMLASHVETEKDFPKAIGLETARRQGKRIPRDSLSPPTLLYSDHVRYVEQLRRLYDAFAPEQVLVLIYEDFRRDNEATVREVLRFLQVDDTATFEPVETKPLKAVRSMRLHQLRRAIRKAKLHPAADGPLSRAIDAVAPQRLRSDALSSMFRNVAYVPPSPPSEEFMLELRRRFKGEVVAASDYLGRDLVTLWCYDDID